EDLDGWKIAENKNAFTVKDGILVVKGRRGHLFYSGDVCNAAFKDFHFKADVMTWPKANSGLYIHTAFQKGGWPRKGYECQVNNTHKDRKKTAGIYGVKDNFKAVAKDNEWFHYEIILTGKRIQTKINGETIIDFTEPENHNVRGWPDRRVSEGTFAIQAHDPGSEVHYKNMMVKTPETEKSAKSKYPAASGRAKPAARQAEKMGRRSAAASLYSRVVRQYPESAAAELARERLKSLRK
ncbi:MAG: family 16 glycoside hydrolase, partial [Planctomycetota bacterium]